MFIYEKFEVFMFIYENFQVFMSTELLSTKNLKCLCLRLFTDKLLRFI